MSDQPFTLLAVHAHPDDESSGTGGILRLACASDIRSSAAEGLALEEVGFCDPKPAEMGVYESVAVLKHDSIEGEACVGPIEVTEQALVAEYHVLAAGFVPEALHAGEITHQHVAGPHPKRTGQPTRSIGIHSASMSQGISVDSSTPWSEGRSASAPCT